ncbi:hypothetical protein N8911_00660 [bacterium]|nr:hypothetical protein [bacterium]
MLRGTGNIRSLYTKSQKKVTTNTETYQGVFRIFDDVKSMEIPAEYLAQGVSVMNEDDISSNEKVSLKTVSKVAKSQGKAQSKIDKLIRKEKN